MKRLEVHAQFSGAQRAGEHPVVLAISAGPCHPVAVGIIAIGLPIAVAVAMPIYSRQGGLRRRECESCGEQKTNVRYLLHISTPCCYSWLMRPVYHFKRTILNGNDR